MSQTNQSKVFSTSSSVGNNLEKYDSDTTTKLSESLAENMEKISNGLKDVQNDFLLLTEKHKEMPDMLASLLEQFQHIADSTQKKNLDLSTEINGKPSS